jgi:hypothetical protein
MSRYVLSNDEIKSIKKLLKKHPEREITPNACSLRGSFVITGFRRYSYRDEVDIEFRGDIFAKYGWGGSNWHSSNIMNNASVIKVNKIIRRHIFNEVKNYCLYFDINIKFLENIKKIKWV